MCLTASLSTLAQRELHCLRNSAPSTVPSPSASKWSTRAPTSFGVKKTFKNRARLERRTAGCMGGPFVKATRGDGPAPCLLEMEREAWVILDSASLRSCSVKSVDTSLAIFASSIFTCSSICCCFNAFSLVNLAFSCCFRKACSRFWSLKNMLKNSGPSIVPSPSASNVSTSAPSSAFVSERSNVRHSCSRNCMASSPAHWNPFRPPKPALLKSQPAATSAMSSTADFKSSSVQGSVQASTSFWYFFSAFFSLFTFSTISCSFFASNCILRRASSVRFILKKRDMNSWQEIIPSPSRSKISLTACSSSGSKRTPKAFFNCSENSCFVMSLSLKPLNNPAFPLKALAAFSIFCIAQFLCISSLSICTFIFFRPMTSESPCPCWAPL
mmetsp:Transcript_12975/g.23764  ORF Transcript_12975/g.23764 Transcript_12975/m.23764 type:complete len:385 (+) Transcript_12975:810-1964(+)